jgi:hypothetical protein
VPWEDEAGNRVLKAQGPATPSTEWLRAHLAYNTSHPPGRNEAGRQQIREGRHVFEAQVLKLGATALDGTASTDAVADQLLALLFGCR